ncbi:MAG: ATP-binding cassette domain-containing protein [Armatimonadetes bacterium]|nr:ATP-binding cassette domain-containing protein [Armatimonadota bacterium]MCX7968454.1 ATP-binding cassette domain-containing protein [Armatimonadota bacterium]MDW8142781.1 ATP-binding cassette domain-containing protein [Armatimonadota bacterium]
MAENLRKHEPIVLLEDIHCRLRDKQVLRGVNLKVWEGEIVAVVGVSGIGKSTLLKIIAGLIPVQKGKIRVFGCELTKCSEEEINKIRQQMGFVFQGGALFDWMTVAENVAFPLRTRDSHLTENEIAERVRKLLDAVGMEGTENLLPEQLSGGMRKRVAIARALIAQPKLILYDEPTSGLDPVMSGVINDLIKQMRDRFGVTEVVVTHDLASAVRFADRIAMLHNGEVIAEAPPNEFLLLSNPVVQQFVKGEAKGPLTEFIDRI